MFQTGITHLPRLEPVRIEGGPRDKEYNPEPRPVAATPEQLEMLRQGAPSLAQMPKKSRPGAAGRFELVGISAGDKAGIVERYQMGESIADLAASYTTSNTRIREILVLAGVEIRPRKGAVEQAASSPEFIHERSKDMSLTAKDIDAIVDAHANGASVPELAARYGSNEATIDYHIARRGRVAKVAKSTDTPESVAEVPTGSGFPEARTDVTDDMVAEIHGRYIRGESLSSLEANLPMSWAGLVYRFRKMGLTYPRPRAEKAAPQRKADPVDKAMLLAVHGRYLAGESMDTMYRDGVYPLNPEAMIRRSKKRGLTYPRPKADAQADCNTTVSHPGHAAAATALREVGFVPGRIATLEAARVAAEALREYGFSEDEIAAAIAKDEPQPELPKGAEPVTNVTSEPPASDEQMDDPELVVAAAPEPPPADEDVAAVARQRARELHRKAQGAHMVVAVQELPVSPVLARKQYSAPRILESGAMFVNNPHAAAKLVENLVAELNQVPGVQAYFEWRSQGSVGQPLAR